MIIRTQWADRSVTSTLLVRAYVYDYFLSVLRTLDGVLISHYTITVNLII